VKEGAVVTRFAPSPTGFIHIGNLFTSMVVERSAHTTGGVAMLRIEDTDKKREVENGITGIVSGLQGFDIRFDEGAFGPDEQAGAYGPYVQSMRGPIYHAFCKELVKNGYAYPCFCSEEEIAAVRERQEKEGVLPGYWGEYAKCRELTFEEIETKIKAGQEYVMRLRSPGKPDGRIVFQDMIRGKIEMDENIVDVVLLKRDGIPTYHFAHVVDDTLMGTTHVIRGEEWLPSVPVHMQLFRVLGLKPMKFIHVSPIMKMDDGSRRKLSKRKDPEAAASYFIEEGYPAPAVIEYLLTIANSNFEEWRRQNPDLPYADFPFRLNKLSQSGALFDMDKLKSVSAQVISRFTAGQVYEGACRWAQRYDPDLYTVLSEDMEYTLGIFSIDRGGKKPRKDIAKWSDCREYVSYFYDRLAPPEPEKSELPDALQREILTAYLSVFSASDDKDAWFEKIKGICPPLGFSPDVKAYRQAPEQYKGHVGDVSAVIRLALTGRKNTPDLYAIASLLGQERCIGRMTSYVARLGASDR